MKKKVNLRPYIFACLFSILIFISVSVYIFYLLFMQKGEYKIIEIEDYRGRRLEDVTFSFDVDVEYKDVKDELDGVIISQSYVGTKKLKNGEKYKICLCVGSYKQKLKSSNIKDIESYFVISDFPFGSVVDEYSFKNEDKKAVYISEENTRTNTVPSVEGMHMLCAIEKIKESGFDVGRINYIFCDDIEGGIVLMQSCPSKALLQVNEDIDLYVSKNKNFDFQEK